MSIPRPGEVGFVLDEILVEFGPGTSPQDIANFDAALQVTPLETQTFALTGRTLRRLRIIGSNSVRNTLHRHGALRPGIRRAGQSLLLRHASAAAGRASNEPSPNPEQYVVSKLHLLEAHRITNGDDVIVAVVDSKIDTQHPDLAGVFAGEYDALGTQRAGAYARHRHGRRHRRARQAHGRRAESELLAVRAFSGEQESAQGTTFNILKGVDWAASKGARIINMSFAGPAIRCCAISWPMPIRAASC